MTSYINIYENAQRAKDFCRTNGYQFALYKEVVRLLQEDYPVQIVAKACDMPNDHVSHIARTHKINTWWHSPCWTKRLSNRKEVDIDRNDWIPNPDEIAAAAKEVRDRWEDTDFCLRNGSREMSYPSEAYWDNYRKRRGIC